MRERVDLEDKAAVTLPAKVGGQLARLLRCGELTVAHMTYPRAGAELESTTGGKPNQRRDCTVHVRLAEQTVLERRVGAIEGHIGPVEALARQRHIPEKRQKHAPTHRRVLALARREMALSDEARGRLQPEGAQRSNGVFASEQSRSTFLDETTHLLVVLEQRQAAGAVFDQVDLDACALSELARDIEETTQTEQSKRLVQLRRAWRSLGHGNRLRDGSHVSCLGCPSRGKPLGEFGVIRWVGLVCGHGGVLFVVRRLV